jgi:hypothetical protein
MSNHLAIATVTASLSHLLQRSAAAAVPGALVSTRRPERVEEGTPQARVNIYLYQVSPNAQLRNADLPTRRSDSTMIQRPTLALDLYYLFSFYGDESRLEPQRLLGKTVSALHAQPVLTPAYIRETIRTLTEPDAEHYLAGSDLAEQIDQVRFTAQALTLEDISKLWSILSFHAPHALSVTYRASVILIEADGQPQRALPVRGGQFQPAPFRQPVIEQIRPVAGGQAPIRAGAAVTIVGRQLRGDITQARIGEVEVTPESEQISDNRIDLTLPASLRAGVQRLQVIHRAWGDAPGVTRRRAESNVAAFVLHPTITIVEMSSQASLTVRLEPAVGRRQRLILWLNEYNPPAGRPAYAYSFDAPAQNGIEDAEAAETNTVAFALAGVEPGDYLVRVQVDGAESPLELDANPDSPTFNHYNNPRITIADA